MADDGRDVLELAEDKERAIWNLPDKVVRNSATTKIRIQSKACSKTIPFFFTRLRANPARVFAEACPTVTRQTNKSFDFHCLIHKITVKQSVRSKPH